MRMHCQCPAPDIVDQDQRRLAIILSFCSPCKSAKQESPRWRSQTTRRKLMNRSFRFALAASLLSSATAVAQPGNFGGNDQGRNGLDRYEAYRNDPGVRM